MKYLFAILTLVAGIFAAVAVKADEVHLGVAPSNPAKAGFSLAVFSERLGNEGFQPITMRFQAIGKSFNRQRQLRIRLRPRTQYQSILDFQFTCDVTVPEGVKAYDHRVLVPSYYRWDSCAVLIEEDGRNISKVPSNLTLPASTQDWGQQMSIGIIVPRDAQTLSDQWATFPDVRSMVTVLGNGPIPTDSKVKRLDSKQARQYAESVTAGYARFRILDEDVLHDSWIGYSQLDLILVPFPTLKRIEREQPERLAELQRWVSAGGQIWTHAAAKGDSLTWLAGPSQAATAGGRYIVDPKRFMQLSGTNDTSPIQYEPWNNGSYYSTGYTYGTNEKARKVVYKELETAKNPMVQVSKRNGLLSQFQTVDYGMGRVVLLHAEDPYPGSFQLWQSLETDWQGWVERNGVDYSAGSDSYWAWVMAAVGQPPVTMFVILNGLFVLVMGPVLYFALRRRGRLYLLYFIAPSLALAVTLGLFFYAFLSDGFDNRARIRQLTWVDGRQPLLAPGSNGRTVFPVVDQSRQTYYTVVDSLQGLRYPSDRLVLPILHTELMDTYSYHLANHRTPGEYLVREDRGHRVYSGDFLPTRTQVHCTVTHPKVDPFPITVSRVDSGMQLTNHLASSMSSVAYRDEQGKYWTGGDVPPGGTIDLQSQRSNVLAAIANRFVEADSSSMPAPYQSRLAANDRTGMEHKILSFVRNPPKGSFIAVTSIEEDQLALRECVQEDCVRVVGGVLP